MFYQAEHSVGLVGDLETYLDRETDFIYHMKFNLFWNQLLGAHGIQGTCTKYLKTPFCTTYEMGVWEKLRKDIT